MKLTKVHLFVILLLALVFCSVFSGVCGGSTLEGFNSGQYSSYGEMYSANNKYANRQDTLYNRKDKPLAQGSSSSNDDDSGSRYAPYSGNSNGNYSNGNYSNSNLIPGGIPGSQIPPGQDDLYILKSEIVPPVCPACPSMKCDGSSGSGGENKCPPCPPCARCPEPAFECKKVPNYNTANDNVFPHPVLNSFSQFGM
jgi:hypothetical protein